MDKEILYENLLKWIQIFDAAKDVTNVEDISDGIVISKILNTIAPDFFTETWLLKIKGNCNDNWRLKLSNLKKVMKSIFDYNTDILDVHFTEFQMPDMNLIAEHNSKVEMGRFLQLVLGCAVNCPQKERYIQAIMSMEEQVQHTVMQAIQELMSTDTRNDTLTELEEKLRKAVEDCNQALESKEEIAQRCHELDMQMSLLMMEKSQLQTENEILLKRLGDVDTHQRIFEHLNNKSDEDISKDDTQESLHKVKQLQDQIDSLQEELFRVDTSKEEYKLKLESLEKENSELRHKVDSMWVGAEELRQLKDELDIMREKASQVGKYETAIEQYKKKFDDSFDIRKDNKELEEKNVALNQKISEYKEELRKSSTLRTQLDIYKREVAEVRTKFSEETKRADTLDFELKRTQEKYESALLEMKHLMSERDSLRDKMEEFELLQCNQNSPHSGSSLAEETGMKLPNHVSDRIVGLEKEVSVLKGRLEAQKLEETATTETLLEDATLRVSQLEAENRLSHQRILELSARVEDLENELLERGGSSDSSLKSPIRTNDSQNRAITAEKEVARLSQKLAVSENDLKKNEQKYMKYLEKARNIIRQLASTNYQDSNGGTPQIQVSQELQSLKNNLLGKEKQFEQLEKQHEREMGIREDEERLIVAAWYNLGVRLNREAAEERLSTPNSGSTPTQMTPNNARPTGAGQSFLARQRLVHTQKSHHNSELPTLSPNLSNSGSPPR